MFTGIIRAQAQVISAKRRAENLVATIEKPKTWKLALGQSIAIDGVCSTVTKVGAKSFEVDWMPETLKKTTVGTFEAGSVVNLEQSLTLKDFVDGHLVQGHVDGTGEVKKVHKDLRGGVVLSLRVPKVLHRYIAQKGSISVNGVSLTVVERMESVFTVALIPYTLEHTNLGLLRAGSLVNIEVDMMARYIVNARV